MRVNVLVAGTQKGGTTALARLLSRHPQVRMARTKEVHYFDADENFAGPGPDYARYHDHFDAPEGRPRWARPRRSTCTGTRPRRGSRPTTRGCG